MNNDPQQPFTQYPPPPPQPPRKKRGPLFWILVVFGAIVAIGLFNSIVNKEPTTTPTPVTQATAQPTDTPVPTATPSPTPKPLKWVTTHNFSGDGDKKTDVFHVGDTWKIIYQCQGFTDGTNIDGDMYIHVYNSDGTTADLSAASPSCKANGWSKGDTTEHQAGDVYLDIGATGAWAIQIQEMK